MVGQDAQAVQRYLVQGFFSVFWEHDHDFSSVLLKIGKKYMTEILE